MKTIVAGGRQFQNYLLMKASLNPLIITEIVSGAAKGADQMGEWYAKEHNIPVRKFPAHWDLYGKSAGIRRNIEMAAYADQLVAFWDRKSRGTKHMIEHFSYAHRNKPISVVYY